MIFKNAVLALMTACLIGQSVALAEPQESPTTAPQNQIVQMLNADLTAWGLDNSISAAAPSNPNVRTIIFQQDQTTAPVAVNFIFNNGLLSAVKVNDRPVVGVENESRSIQAKIAAHQDLVGAMLSDPQSTANQDFLNLISDETDSIMQKLFKVLPSPEGTAARRPADADNANNNNAAIAQPGVHTAAPLQSNLNKRRWSIDLSQANLKQWGALRVNNVGHALYYFVNLSILSYMVFTAFVYMPLFAHFAQPTFHEVLPAVWMEFTALMHQFIAKKAAVLIGKWISKKSADAALALQDVKDQNSGVKDESARAEILKRRIPRAGVACRTLLSKTIEFVVW